MINLADNECLIRCACGGKEHIVSLIHEPDDSRGNALKCSDDDWYLSILLDPVQPWWRRLWRARRPHGRFGMYAEVVLRNDDAWPGRRVHSRAARGARMTGTAARLV